MEEASKEAADHLAALQRIGIEQVMSSVPPEVSSEALRAWINYVLGALVHGTEFETGTTT
jgi:hypothetical protein